MVDLYGLIDNFLALFIITAKQITLNAIARIATTPCGIGFAVTPAFTNSSTVLILVISNAVTPAAVAPLYQEGNTENGSVIWNSGKIWANRHQIASVLALF